MRARCPPPASTGEFAWHYLRRLARRELVRLPERSARLGTMAASGDGRTAAAWYHDATIVLWDLPTERPSRTIGLAKCGEISLSEDGRTLAAEEDFNPLDEARMLALTVSDGSAATSRRSPSAPASGPRRAG